MNVLQRQRMETEALVAAQLPCGSRLRNRKLAVWGHYGLTIERTTSKQFLPCSNIRTGWAFRSTFHRFSLLKALCLCSVSRCLSLLTCTCGKVYAKRCRFSSTCSVSIQAAIVAFFMALVQSATCCELPSCAASPKYWIECA